MKKPRSKEEATHRLSDMETKEVSLVDRAANLRNFLVVKSEGVEMSVPAKATAETTQKEAMTLPEEDRTAMIGILHDALEVLTGVATTLKESTIDDSASVPPELAKMFSDAGKKLMKSVSKYLESGSPSDDESGDDKAKGDDESKTDSADGDVEKARRLTPARRAKLVSLRDDLSALIDETADPSADSDADSSDPAEKSDVTSEIVSALALINGKFDEFEKKLETRVADVAKAEKKASDVEKALMALRSELNAPGDSRVQSDESSDSVEKRSSEVDDFWPSDFSTAVMNEEV